MPPTTLPAAKPSAATSTLPAEPLTAEPPASPQVPPSDRRRLTSVEPARWYVAGFDLPEIQEHRLRTMGLFEGQTVLLIKRCNPVIIKVAGARVALASEIAGGVYVSATCALTA